MNAPILDRLTSFFLILFSGFSSHFEMTTRDNLDVILTTTTPIE